MILTLFLACCHKIWCYFDVFIPVPIVITRFGNIWHKSFVISGRNSVTILLFSMIFTLFLACYHKICYHYLLLSHGLETFGIKAVLSVEEIVLQAYYLYIFYTISCLLSQDLLLYRYFHTITYCYHKVWKRLA